MLTHFAEQESEATKCGERPYHCEARGDSLTDLTTDTTCPQCKAQLMADGEWTETSYRDWKASYEAPR